MQAHLSSLCACMKPFYRHALTHLSLSSVFAKKIPAEYEQDCSCTIISQRKKKDLLQVSLLLMLFKH